MNPRALAELDSACTDLIEALATAQDRAHALSTLATWGLGEAEPSLRAAQALVRIFREKAAGGPGDAHSALGDHLAEAAELRGLLNAVATALPQADETFAQQFGQLDT